MTFKKSVYIFFFVLCAFTFPNGNLSAGYGTSQEEITRRHNLRRKSKLEATKNKASGEMAKDGMTSNALDRQKKRVEARKKRQELDKLSLEELKTKGRALKKTINNPKTFKPENDKICPALAKKCAIYKKKIDQFTKLAKKNKKYKKSLASYQKCYNKTKKEYQEKLKEEYQYVLDAIFRKTGKLVKDID